MVDRFRNRETSLEAPARRAEAVVPSDAADLPNFTRALYVGTAGDVDVTTVGGDDVVIVGAKGFLPICVARVRATGTTAADIVALW